MIVREFRESDAEATQALRRLAFGGPRPDRPPRMHRGWRAHVVELDGRVAGHLRIHDHRQFFGGRAVPMGGLASVAVEPYARGRGLASALLDVGLADMRAHGQCVSTLFASAPPLYRRRGWEQTGSHLWATVPLHLLAAVPKPAVRHEIRPASKADLTALHNAYLATAATIDGMLDRATDAFNVEHVLDLDIVDLVVGADGVLGYVTAERPIGDELAVYDIVATDQDTARTLLRHLATWSGQLREVSLPVVDRVLWDLVLAQPIHYDVNNHPWMFRVVDLPAAIAARGWPAAAFLRPFTVDIDVIDEHAPWHAGPHRLVVDNGEVRCEPGGTGSVRMSARALGPWFAGTADSGMLRRAGLIDGDPVIAARLDLLTGAPHEARIADAF